MPRYCLTAKGWFDRKDNIFMPAGWEPAISFFHGGEWVANEYTGTCADVQIKPL